MLNLLFGRPSQIEAWKFSFTLHIQRGLSWLWGGGVAKALRWEANRSRSPPLLWKSSRENRPCFLQLAALPASVEVLRVCPTMLAWLPSSFRLLLPSLLLCSWHLAPPFLPWRPSQPSHLFLFLPLSSTFLLLLPHPHFASCTNSLCSWVSILLKNRLCFSFPLIQPVLSLVFHLSQSLGHVWNYVFSCSCLVLKKKFPFLGLLVW